MMQLFMMHYHHWTIISVCMFVVVVVGGGWFVTTTITTTATTITSPTSSINNHRRRRQSISSLFTSSNNLFVSTKRRRNTGSNDNDDDNNNVTTFVSKSTSRNSSIKKGGHVNGIVQSFLNTIYNSRRHLLAAAIARSTSILIMYPADVIKTRLQLLQSNPLRVTGLFNGVIGSLLGQVPYGVLTFGSYEMYKSYLLDMDRINHVPPILKYAFAAILGDLTGSGWLCPSEVIKQKVQGGIYPSTISAVVTIWKEKGFIGYYEGYFGGIARDVPFRVAQLTSYELTKNLYLRIKQQRKVTAAAASTNRRTKTNKQQPIKTNDTTISLSPGEAALCGAIAGSFSAAITAPLDRVKTLLMTNSAAYGGTVLSCVTKIWKEEGICGLTTGVVPRVMYIAPSVAIFFVAYEMTQQRLQHWQQKTQ